MHKLLLLDFDGTLCLGEDPILSYAAQVDATLKIRDLPGPGGRTVTEVVSQALNTDQLLVSEIQYDAAGVPLGAHTSGTNAAAAHPQSWPLQDGYQLVQLLAVQCGLSLDETGQAFRDGRRDLLSLGLENTDLHAPVGAAELLDEVRAAGGGVVLVTNAPAEGFGTWLSALGLTQSFDAVINSAQKPMGMPQAVAEARASANMVGPDEGLLTVGDIWANDCSHVHQIGGQTILIDRFSTGLGDPDHRVSDFAAAAPIIRRWAAVTVG